MVTSVGGAADLDGSKPILIEPAERGVEGPNPVGAFPLFFGWEDKEEPVAGVTTVETIPTSIIEGRETPT